jgi:hypothetical protein
MLASLLYLLSPSPPVLAVLLRLSLLSLSACPCCYSRFRLSRGRKTSGSIMRSPSFPFNMVVVSRVQPTRLPSPAHLASHSLHLTAHWLPRCTSFLVLSRHTRHRLSCGAITSVPLLIVGTLQRSLTSTTPPLSTPRRGM